MLTVGFVITFAIAIVGLVTAVIGLITAVIGLVITVIGVVVGLGLEFIFVVFLAVLAWLYMTIEGWTWFFGVIAFNVSVAFLFGLAVLLLSRKIPEPVSNRA